MYCMCLAFGITYSQQLDETRGEIIFKYGKCILKNSKGIKIAQCILEANLYKLRSLTSKR
jgi:hypothetical protein